MLVPEPGLFREFMQASGTQTNIVVFFSLILGLTLHTWDWTDAAYLDADDEALIAKANLCSAASNSRYPLYTRWSIFTN